MALSRDKILKHAGVFTTREVHVPEWADESGDDVVLVRGVTVREYEVNLASIGSRDGKSSAGLVARCALDPSGARLFEDKDIDAIAEIPLKQMMELTNAISQMSGLLDEDEKPKADDDEASGDPAEGEVEPGKAASPALSSSGPSGSELRAI